MGFCMHGPQNLAHIKSSRRDRSALSITWRSLQLHRLKCLLRMANNALRMKSPSRLCDCPRRAWRRRESIPASAMRPQGEHVLSWLQHPKLAGRMSIVSLRSAAPIYAGAPDDPLSAPTTTSQMRWLALHASASQRHRGLGVRRSNAHSPSRTPSTTGVSVRRTHGPRV